MTAVSGLARELPAPGDAAHARRRRGSHAHAGGAVDAGRRASRPPARPGDRHLLRGHPARHGAEPPGGRLDGAALRVARVLLRARARRASLLPRRCSCARSAAPARRGLAARRRPAPATRRCRRARASSRTLGGPSRGVPAYALAILGRRAARLRLGGGAAHDDLAGPGARSSRSPRPRSARAPSRSGRASSATSPAGGSRTRASAGRRAGRLWSLVIMTVGCTPFGVAFYLMSPGHRRSSTSAGPSPARATTAYFGPLFAIVQEVSPVADPLHGGRLRPARHEPARRRARALDHRDDRRRVEPDDAAC